MLLDIARCGIGLCLVRSVQPCSSFAYHGFCVCFGLVWCDGGTMSFNTLPSQKDNSGDLAYISGWCKCWEDHIKSYLHEV
jgi:hypothetical protein